MKVVSQSVKIISEVSSLIKKGGVIVCPTDTVYGFLADATNKKAVEKIYKIKKRPKSKPLPIFVKDLKMAHSLAKISKEQKRIIKKYWPGKYTFILKRKNSSYGSSDVGRRMLYGVDKNTIALRIPRYKFLNDLLKKVNRPLVQTSVNVSGKSSLIKISDIKKLVNSIGRMGLPMLIIEGGNLKKAKPSKIIDLVSRKLTRLR